MKRILITLLALIVAACSGTGTGRTTTTTPSSTTTPPGAPADLVLQITDDGGFVPVEVSLSRMPRFRVYSDGTFYFQGAVPAIYPGPLLPNVLVARLGSDDYAAVLDQIERVGLPEVVDEINNSASSRVADASTVIATYYDEAGSHRYGVYALDFGSFQDPRVAELSSLLRLLDDIAANIDADTYVPEELKVWVGEAQFIDPQVGLVNQWSFDLDPGGLAPEPFGFACTMLAEDAAADALTAFTAAHQQTFWERDGVAWQLIPVPILPGQEGCAS